MPSNRDRLYVALYARGGSVKMPGGEDKYHWALLAGPKREDATPRGKRYHAKETMLPTRSWTYSEQDVAESGPLMLLVRVQLGKIQSMERLEAVLRRTPIRGASTPGWNCEALAALAADRQAMATAAVLDWTTVRDASMAYVADKAQQHRFDGQAPLGQFDLARPPTWDLVAQKEVIP